MKIRKVKIKDKDYFYASDTIFIAKGQTIQKQKSLGPANSLKNLGLKKQEFSKYLLEEEVVLRTDYWGKKLKDFKYVVNYVSLNKIESLRSKLFRSKQEMGEFSTSLMETAFMVDFIYNSNKIEGSRFPREKVEKIVRERSTDQKNNEVDNTIKAIAFVDSGEFKFTIKDVSSLQSVLLEHEPKKTGLRKEKIIVGNSEVLDWGKIVDELKKLLKWYKEVDKTLYPLELAFSFYYRFERIHPFVDGNGRVGRLLMNKILKDHKYHPIIIWSKHLQAHYNAFEKGMGGFEGKYLKFMTEQFIKTHEIYIKKIEQVFDAEKQMKSFMKPSE